MSENATTVETETNETEFDFEGLVADVVAAVFGTDETVTPYKVAVAINKTFEAVGAEKRIVPQMMYNYDRNGMIVKGIKGRKSYNKDETEAFVTKFVAKHS